MKRPCATRDHEIPPWRRSRSAIRPRRTAARPGGMRLRLRRLSASGPSACRHVGTRTGPSPDTNALPLHLPCLSPSKSRTVLNRGAQCAYDIVLDKVYSSKILFTNLKYQCGRADVLIRRISPAAREDTRPPYPRAAWSWGSPECKTPPLLHLSPFPVPHSNSSRPFCS